MSWNSAEMRCLVAAVALVAVLAAVEGQSPSECKQEKNQLVLACGSVVLLGQNPSQSCCEQVRAVHVECICPLVTPKIANLINLDRVIKQIEACQRIVPRGFKCGSITTPS